MFGVWVWYGNGKALWEDCICGREDWVLIPSVADPGRACATPCPRVRRLHVHTDEDEGYARGAEDRHFRGFLSRSFTLRYWGNESSPSGEHKTTLCPFRRDVEISYPRPSDWQPSDAPL